MSRQRNYFPCITLGVICAAIVGFIVYALWIQGMFSMCYGIKIRGSRADTFSSMLQVFTEELNNHKSPDSYTTTVRSRIKELKTIRLPINSTHARPFLRIKSYYRIAPRYHLTSCLVEKAMCTILQNIFCYLYDTQGFVTNNRTISTDTWEKRFCLNRNELKSTQEKHLLVPFNPSTIFMVRSPIERFLSGFIDKCINEKSTCYKCKGNILCVVEGLHKEIMTMNKQHYNISVRKTGPVKQSYEATHMAPSHWQCDLPEESDSYNFIRYGETAEEIKKTYLDLILLLESHGVEKEKIDYIYSSITKRTKHATKSSGMREKYLRTLKSSPWHVQLLNDIYFYDYQVFGYDPL